MGVPTLSSNQSKCTTCGHHKRDHGSPMGCARCSDQHQHKFLNSRDALGLIDSHPDWQDFEAAATEEMRFEYEGQLPATLEMQARMFALDASVKTYQERCDVEDNPPTHDFVTEQAEVYLQFLMKRTHSTTQ